jgi:hypothetical protein
VALDIDKALRVIREAAADGLYRAGEHVLNESNRRVPLEYGDLQGSGTVSEDRARLEVAVSYDTPYAARQHEEMSYRHDPGRSAKFLETAANGQAKTAGQIVANTVRARVGN